MLSMEHVFKKFLLWVLFIKPWILNHNFWVKDLWLGPSVSPRAGVEIIREPGGEDWSGGKPQEANWRQVIVIHQMFATYTKGQWLWGRLTKEVCHSRSERLLRWKHSEDLETFDDASCRDDVSFVSKYVWYFNHVSGAYTGLTAAQGHFNRTLGWRESNPWRTCLNTSRGKWHSTHL